jgi:cytochrome b561
MTARFTLFSRLLHWTMAAMVLAMLFIGVAMVASLADYHRLVAIHRPLGILILVLVVIRLAYRVLRPAPHLPPILPHDDDLYALLRPLHAAFAFLLFATFLVHLGAAMMHALIFRDGVFQRMASWRR